MTPVRDKASTKSTVVALAAATLAADADSGVIDLGGCRAATLELSIGVGGITFTGTNKIEYVLTHGSLSDGTDQVAVTDDDVVKDSLAATTITNGIIRALTSAHAAADVQELGYIGGRRYVKLAADFSGTHGTGTPMAATWTKEELDFEGAA